MSDILIDFNPGELIKSGFSILESSEDGERYHNIFQYVLVEKLDFLEILAGELMNQAISQFKVWTDLFQSENLVIALAAFPCSIQEAKCFYYIRGYLHYLENVRKVSSSMNPISHFLHIQFFHYLENDYKIQMTFWPEKKLLPFTPTFYVPSELLHPEESLKLKLGYENTQINPSNLLRKIGQLLKDKFRQLRTNSEYLFLEEADEIF